MAFCANCGRELDASMRFCPGCGAAQQTDGTAGTTAVSTNVNPIYTSQNLKSDYRVILLDLGSCTRSTARNLLEDLMGYSDGESRSIVNSIPAEIACCLNEQQACTLAQALTEYGMQVTVCDEDDYVDLNRYATSSVYSENGTLLGSALAVLATLSLVNRVKQIRRWDRPGLLERLFMPTYRRPVPPPIRHHIHPVYTHPVHIPIRRHPLPPLRGPAGPRAPMGPGIRGPRPGGSFGHIGGPGGNRGPGGRGPGGRGPGGHR